MLGFYGKIWYFLAFVTTLLGSHQCWSKPLADSAATAKVNETTLPQIDLISDDVIHDAIEQDTKRVIRVNPLDLPPLKGNPDFRTMDSALYKIQSLKPYNGQRKYVNMQRTKPSKAQSSRIESPIVRGFSASPTGDKAAKAKHRLKHKQLHFFYNQENLAGNLVPKSMLVHVAQGAYPVYYLVDKTNGRFGKYPLKDFASPQAFKKYLQKKKLVDTTAMASSSVNV